MGQHRCAQRTCETGEDASEDVLTVLQKDLGLWPFGSVVAARLLALIDPRLYDYNRKDLGRFVRMGPGARMGLGLLFGMDAELANEFPEKGPSARGKRQYNVTTLPCVTASGQNGQAHAVRIPQNHCARGP